jgi:hypothetical protein
MRYYIIISNSWPPSLRIWVITRFSKGAWAWCFRFETGRSLIRCGVSASCFFFFKKNVHIKLVIRNGGVNLCLCIESTDVHIKLLLNEVINQCRSQSCALFIQKKWTLSLFLQRSLCKVLWGISKSSYHKCIINNFMHFKIWLFEPVFNSLSSDSSSVS